MCVALRPVTGVLDTLLNPVRKGSIFYWEEELWQGRVSWQMSTSVSYSLWGLWNPPLCWYWWLNVCGGYVWSNSRCDVVHIVHIEDVAIRQYFVLTATFTAMRIADVRILSELVSDWNSQTANSVESTDLCIILVPGNLTISSFHSRGLTCEDS